MRWLDFLHARYHNDGKFFSQGWGDRELLKQSLIQRQAPPPVEVEFSGEQRSRLLRFRSPRASDLPSESQVAEALFILPQDWTLETPICVQLAATGDEGFEDRKRIVADPLTNKGVGSVIVENPYYGSRRPQGQDGTYVSTVSDLWAMGLAVVAETRALLAWLRSQGFQNLGVSGVSMGGAMVSQAAALTNEPLAVCACIAPHCATPVFLDGVLSRYVDWEALGGGDQARRALAAQLDGTDLRCFPPPYRPDCTIWLAAKRDAYVDPDSCSITAQAWPGSRMRWLNNGHVGTTLFHRGSYLQGILDSFALLRGTGHELGTWLP